MRYIIILATITVARLSGYSQTCVIAKKTKDAIYVGADSRINKQPFGTDITTDTGSIRKIYKCGQVNYAVIGSFGTEVINELNGKCTKSSTANYLDIAYRNFGYKLRNTLLALRKQDERTFNAFIKEWGKAISQVIIFGKEADSLFMYRIKIYYDNITQDIRFERSIRTDLLYAGEVDEISPYLEDKKTWIANPVTVIKRFIDTSAAYNKLKVGGKTIVMKVTLKGAFWLP